MPPPVEPAHAPINIRKTRIIFVKTGQVSKFVVEKPVVVIIEATWKTEYLIESPTEYFVFARHI